VDQKLHQHALLGGVDIGQANSKQKWRLVGAQTRMKSLIKTKGDSKHINHRYNVTITRVASSFRNRVPVRGCTVHHQIGMDQILWEQLKCGYRKLFYDMRCATGTQVQTFLTASLRAGPQEKDSCASFDPTSKPIRCSSHPIQRWVQVKMGVVRFDPMVHRTVPQKRP